MFGTSTGGLIAILLGRLRLTVKEALRIYEDLAGEVFGKQRWFSIRSPLLWPRGKYNHRKLECAIKGVVQCHAPRLSSHAIHKVAGNVFNPDPTFNSEPLLCRTVCISYLSRGKRRNEPFLFRSYEHAPSILGWARNPGPGHAIPIWKVGRATAAAPSYFEPMEIDDHKFLDGGVGCNNPSFEAFQELMRMHNHSPSVIGHFMSIGTGSAEFDLSGGSGWTNMLQNFRAIAKVVTNSEPPHDTLAQMHQTYKLPYVRLDVTGDLGSLKMDTWRTKRSPTRGQDRVGQLGEKGGDEERSLKDSPTETLKEHKNTQDWIRQETARYLQEPETADKLQKTAEYLVQSRRDRASTARWEFYASGARYRCIFDQCPAATSTKIPSTH